LTRGLPDTAEALGMVRAGAFGFVLCEVLLTSLPDLGRLPVTVLRPTGAMRLLPWGFYERLLTPASMSAFKWVFVAALLAATVGALTPVSTKAAAGLFLFYQGLLRSFSHFNHDEMPAAYILLVLAFTPCGDAFSLDALRGRRGEKHGGSWVYGYPILLTRLLLAWSYFTSALIKLRVAGLGYFSPDNLPALAVSNSLDNLHDTQFRAGLWLPAYREYTTPLVALVVLWELLFPLAVWLPRARPVILTAGVLFHLGTFVFMNIFFPYHVAMYLVFVDWPWVRDKARALFSRVGGREAGAAGA
jgi:uncharacterized membrane protein YphA (DoxX/SURF4 family)